jgi:hypothetical protein
MLITNSALKIINGSSMDGWKDPFHNMVIFVKGVKNLVDTIQKLYRISCKNSGIWKDNSFKFLPDLENMSTLR